MKILILGSEGFIGSNLVRFYLKQGWKVFGADLMETGTKKYHYYKISRLSPEYDELLQNFEFEVCINAAGSGNVPYSMTHPVTDFEANSLDAIRLLDGIRRFRPACKYLHISSAAVYGNPATLPVSERDQLQPISPYGWHKLIAEQICQEYSQVFNISTAIVRPFSVYGPGLKKQLFWDLFRRGAELDSYNVIELWGTGKESRDFIYIDDLIEAFHCIIQKGKFKGEDYNIANGEETTIEKAVELFFQSFKKSLRIKFNNQERHGDPKRWKADIEKIKALGYSNQVSLNQGISTYVDWLKSFESL